MLCGTPDEVCEQIARWGDVGCDQLVFGLPTEGLYHDEILEMLELFGDKVIPEFDKDRTHSTDYYRATAKPKYPARSTKPFPEDVEWPTQLPGSPGSSCPTDAVQAAHCRRRPRWLRLWFTFLRNRCVRAGVAPAFRNYVNDSGNGPCRWGGHTGRRAARTSG